MIDIIDGAMGTEFILHGEQLPPHIWSAEINISNPNLLHKIHKEYVEAGANYLTTNTFRSTPRAFKKTGLSDSESIIAAKQSMKSAVKRAITASGKYTKVMGSIAPLEDCYSPNLFPGTEVAINEYDVITRWLKYYGVDGFLLETMNSIKETKACLESIKKSKLTTWVSFNLLDSYHIKSGEKLKDAIDMLYDYNVECILLNCNPIDRTHDALEILADRCTKWGIYPNLGVGEPSPDGVIKEYYSDDEFLNLCKDTIELGASVLGGCCGSRPNHIKLLSDTFNS